MARIRRSSSPELMRARLEKKHATLDERVAELSTRPFLTPTEEVEHRRLKKQKLLAKDALGRMPET